MLDYPYGIVKSRLPLHHDNSNEQQHQLKLVKRYNVRVQRRTNDEIPGIMATAQLKMSRQRHNSAKRTKV